MTPGITASPWGRDCPACRRSGAVAAAVVWLAACLLILAPAPPPSLAAEAVCEELLETEEGRRLVGLWQDMLDHSSDLIYSPSLFQALADDLEAARADLVSLYERRVLGDERAECLGRLFSMRYAYIRDWHYSKRSVVRLSGGEATRKAALWVIELELSVLRRPPKSKAEEELARSALRNIGYELMFIHHLDKFELEADRRRIALKDREDAGEEVDLEAFEAEYLARRSLLLQAYRHRRLPSVRSVDEILPYVAALTRAEPSLHAAARESNRAEPL